MVQQNGLGNIQVAKNFVQAGLGLEDPSLLSEGFYFLGTHLVYHGDIHATTSNWLISDSQQGGMLALIYDAHACMSNWFITASTAAFDVGGASVRSFVFRPPRPKPKLNRMHTYTKQIKKPDPLEGAQSKKAYLQSGEKLNLRAALPDLDFRCAFMYTYVYVCVF